MLKITGPYLLLGLILSLCWHGEDHVVEGWGQEGHSVVAALAQSLLTNHSMEWVRYLEQNKTASLVDICAEADAYDATPAGKWSAGLHFANIPFLARQFDYTRDCAASIKFHCVVSAIFNYSALLEEQTRPFENSLHRVAQQQQLNNNNNKNKKDDPPTVPEPTPLAFVVHLTGDIHQPLHVSYQCDEGGNLVNTSNKWNNDQVAYANLHSVWDNSILQQYSTSYSVWVARLQRMIQDNPAVMQLAVTDFTPINWAHESYAITRTYAYWFDMPYDIPPLQAADMHYPSSKACPLSGINYLSDSYLHNASPIVADRLLYAGIRLAHLLNSIFEKRSPPPPWDEQ